MILYSYIHNHSYTSASNKKYTFKNQDTLRKKITYGITGCGKRETFIFRFSNHVADGTEEGCCDRNSKQPLFHPLKGSRTNISLFRGKLASREAWKSTAAI
ncbi:hypothetical protein CEXT_249741 [Caerostris extrusa]|uniref:Uncharacterized protein n=1 Tax=Caerostris extrusa TaxID=172846 RepID=A0AAV4TE30_CAEEX|nr:hypothetical protein CEXT_249741 [Caerostris extrusa]